MGCQCDVIRVKSFYEILSYLFQVLATPYLLINAFICLLYYFLRNGLLKMVHFLNRKFLIKGLFIWRRTGPVRRASSSEWDDFYPHVHMESSISVQSKSLLCRWKRLFDQVVFTINSDVKPSCRTNVLTLCKENSVLPCRAGPLASFHMEDFHLT